VKRCCSMLFSTGIPAENNIVARGRSGHARSGDARSRLAALLVDEVGDQPGPARLMAGAQPHAGLAVEVLVEEQGVPPRWVGAEALVAAPERTCAALVQRVEADHALRGLRGHLGGGQLTAGGLHAE